jgi:alpha-mannosidase
VAAVKPAEDGNGIILRLFETDGVAASCRLSLAKDLVQMMQTDLMERELNAVVLENGEADLNFGPFEILTLKIR